MQKIEIAEVTKASILNRYTIDEERQCTERKKILEVIEAAPIFASYRKLDDILAYMEDSVERLKKLRTTRYKKLYLDAGGNNVTVYEKEQIIETDTQVIDRLIQEEEDRRTRATNIEAAKELLKKEGLIVIEPTRG